MEFYLQALNAEIKQKEHDRVVLNAKIETLREMAINLEIALEKDKEETPEHP